MDAGFIDVGDDEQTRSPGRQVAWSPNDAGSSMPPGSPGPSHAVPRFGAGNDTSDAGRPRPASVATTTRTWVATTMRTWVGIVGACILPLVASACASSAGHSGAEPAVQSPALAQRDFAGLVDIGGGREIWATCRGQGSPTVVLLSGHGNGAEDWSLVLDPSDPAHQAPGDDVSAGLGRIAESDDAVFPSIARTTRVCTYDRPDIRFTGEVTTPRPQPHKVDVDVSDLHALLAAIGEPGPYVVVSHSYGGLVSTLYARTYPESIAGLVMVDTVSEVMEDLVTPGALDWWDEVNAATNDVVREGVMIKDAFAQINAAKPMPRVPAIVLVADKPFREDLIPPEQLQGEHTTFDDWVAMVNRLGVDLGAKTITKTDSGHNIYLYNPQLVIDSIDEVVSEVRTDQTSRGGGCQPAASC